MNGLKVWRVRNRTTVIWTLLVLGSVFLSTCSVHAFSWQQGELRLEEKDAPQRASSDCQSKKVKIGSPISFEEATICVYEGKNYRYGTYSRSGGWWSPSVSNLVVGFGHDEAMYIVRNVQNANNWLHVPYSDHVIANHAGQWMGNNNALAIAEYFGLSLRPSTSLLGITEYQLASDVTWKPLFPNEQGSYTTTGTAKASANGKWIAFEARNLGLGLYDIDKREIRWFSNYRHGYGFGSDAHISFAVSEDGTQVATFDYNISPRIYSLDDDCVIITERIEDRLQDDLNQNKPSPCPYRTLTSEYTKKFDYQRTRSLNNPKFNYEGSALTVETWSENNNWDDWENQVVKEVTLYANGYKEKRLEYLALGDSYSSGEGDTEKDAYGKKYYRTYTDVEEDRSMLQPREKCHVSTRSYPYLLAQSMGLGDPLSHEGTKWQTVACSGATTWDMKDDNSADYTGQANRISGYDVAGLKHQALNEFIPGRLKQLEFVKKYQPKVITLTAGGNDVDFGGKLSNCVIMIGTCIFATDDFKSELKRELTDQFDNLSSFYSKLKRITDGNSRIIVIGYPNFISDVKDAPCKNTFNLNFEEREMIVSSINYLNNVIKAATEKAGVHYVDVEETLVGGRLCESNQAYVTAITNIFGFNGNERQEAFHPNAYGHKQIARDISTAFNASGTLSPTPVPVTKDDIESNSYFSGNQSDAKFINQSFSNDSLVIGSPSSLKLDQFSFDPSSTVIAEIRSKPLSLGEFTADSDGSLSAEIVLPTDFEIGYHTLILKGLTKSKESVSYYQNILVLNEDRQFDVCDNVNISNEFADNSELIEQCVQNEALKPDSYGPNEDISGQLAQREKSVSDTERFLNVEGSGTIKTKVSAEDSHGVLNGDLNQKDNSEVLGLRSKSSRAVDPVLMLVGLILVFIGISSMIALRRKVKL